MSDDATPRSHKYTLETNVAGLALRATVDGITVRRETTSYGSHEKLDLTPWISNVDDHELRVWLAPLAGADRPPHFLLQLHRHPPKGELTGNTWIGAFTWTARESALVDGQFIEVFTQKWKVPEANRSGRWSWEDGEAYQESDRPDIEHLIERVHSGVAARHMSMLHKLFSEKYKELARAGRCDVNEIREAQVEYFEPFFDADDFMARPLKKANLRLEPEADGRLVHVLHEDGSPPIAGVGNGAPIYLHVTVAKVDDVWLVVR